MVIVLHYKFHWKHFHHLRQIPLNVNTYSNSSASFLVLCYHKTFFVFLSHSIMKTELNTFKLVGPVTQSASIPKVLLQQTVSFDFFRLQSRASTGFVSVWSNNINVLEQIEVTNFQTFFYSKSVEFQNYKVKLAYSKIFALRF